MGVFFEKGKGSCFAFGGDKECCHFEHSFSEFFWLLPFQSLIQQPDHHLIQIGGAACGL